MTDCDHPKCHENMLLRFAEINACLQKKVPKKTAWFALWSALVVICIPLFSIGVTVWSEQSSDHLRYVEKDAMVEFEKEQVLIRSAVKHLSADVEIIRSGQKEIQSDVKEILRHLRDN